uniref:Uncharacterized protein LOC100183944 n=1 Tax=Phallusia mammillata TaxID=59560 RepID=A0A6F9DH89_9ASCI|nr:uncharacterized protein LOC100183944 [Phallusia mammillata]
MWVFTPSFLTLARLTCRKRPRLITQTTFKINRLLYLPRECGLSTQCLEAFDMPTLDLLHQSKFLKTSSGADETVLDLLSLELINNVKKEWWKKFVMDKTDVTKIELEDFSKRCSDGQSILSNIVFEHWKKPENTKEKKLSSTAVNIVSKGGEADYLFLMLPCSKTPEMQYEESLSQQLRFLKKYIRKPAQLVAETVNGQTDVLSSIVYKHNESKIEIVDCKLMNHNQLKNFSEWNEIASSLQPISSICTIFINVTSLLCAICLDAYHKVSFPNYEATLFCLHPYIAPVKVAIAIEGKEKNEKLTEVADYLVQRINGMNVNCWNASEMNLTFSDLDHCGVMYCVILNDETIENGIVLMRNRDTSIKMPLHFTEVMAKLHLYLNPR